MADVPAKTDGRFQKGISGNPLGRPRKSDLIDLKQGMEIALREHVKPEQLKKILTRIVNMAIGGDVKAAKLILEFFVSKARDTEDAPDAARQYVFKIENATFGAISPSEQNSNQNLSVIDVTPREDT